MERKVQALSNNIGAKKLYLQNVRKNWAQKLKLQFWEFFLKVKAEASTLNFFGPKHSSCNSNLVLGLSIPDSVWCIIGYQPENINIIQSILDFFSESCDESD